MSKELCFILNEKELFLDQVLVEYNDIPVFFVCKSFDEYYVVLCTDIDNLEYIIVHSSLNEIWGMLHQKINMREIFLTKSTFWKVISGQTLDQDKITLNAIQSIDLETLPLENALYQILTPSVRKYCSNIENKVFEENNFVNVPASVSSVETFIGDARESLEEGTCTLVERYLDFVHVTDENLWVNSVPSRAEYDAQYIQLLSQNNNARLNTTAMGTFRIMDRLSDAA